MGITAGSGIDGAGDADRLMEPNDDLRLWLTTLGGSIGKASVVGVPGADGAGELKSTADSVAVLSALDRRKSGGAGLLDEILL